MGAETRYSPKLLGKIKISAKLRLLTGLHIGASKDLSSIGAVDSVVVRDPLTKRPVIPGSSVKGKLRHLISRTHMEGPFYRVEEEPMDLKRLFGGVLEDGGKRQLVPARLQFADLFISDENADRLEKMDSDLYLSEIKFENTINRLTGEATPRQMERVLAGTEFDFVLIYNAENSEEIIEDFENLATAIKMLHMDYLGGGGTRGNGRVLISDFSVQMLDISGEMAVDKANLEELLEGTKEYALLSV